MDLRGTSDPRPVRVTAVLGRMTEGVWPDRLSRCGVEVLRLSPVEAQRSRLRKRADGGTDVAIALERGTVLRDGDVVSWDEGSHAALVVRVDLTDVLIIDLSALLGEPPESLLARCIEVGHALGNQHWPVVVAGSRVYAPVTLARDVMAAVLNTHGCQGVSYSFVRGADVLSGLAPQDARLLFAGAGDHGHHIGRSPAGEEAE
jgi:urease accessory protein